MRPLVLYLFCLILTSCSPQEQTTEKHVFYLHGRIVEVQGTSAVSEQFGPYLYQAILDSLSEPDIILHAEVRNADVDFSQFTIQISNQIDSLIKVAVDPKNLTVVGASKGAVMAMNISNLNTHPINYVLLGANNDYIENENDWSLHGNILGIYESSDSLAGKNYDHWISRSNDAKQFKQLKIETGLGHGFLYRPIAEWLGPCREWIGKLN